MDTADEFDEQLDRLLDGDGEATSRDPLLRIAAALGPALPRERPSPEFRARLKGELLERYADNVRPFPAAPPAPQLQRSRAQRARRAAALALGAAAAIALLIGYRAGHEPQTRQGGGDVAQATARTASPTPIPPTATPKPRATLAVGGSALGNPNSSVNPPHPSVPSPSLPHAEPSSTAFPTGTGVPTSGPQLAEAFSPTPTPPGPTASPHPTYGGATSTALPTASVQHTAIIAQALTRTPVPSATPPLASVTPLPSATSAPPTDTPAVPSATPVPPIAAATSTPASTATPIPSSTPGPTHTGLPTDTPIPATATYTPRPTRQRPTATAQARPSDTPRSTSVPPSETPVPTGTAPRADSTATAPATATPQTQRDTPVPATQTSVPATPVPDPTQTTAAPELAQVSPTVGGAVSSGPHPPSSTPTPLGPYFPLPLPANAGHGSPLGQTQPLTPGVGLRVAGPSIAVPTALPVLTPVPQVVSARETLLNYGFVPVGAFPPSDDLGAFAGQVSSDGHRYRASLTAQSYGHRLVLQHVPSAAETPSSLPGFDSSGASAAAAAFLHRYQLDGNLKQEAVAVNGNTFVVSFGVYLANRAYKVAGSGATLVYSAGGLLLSADIRLIDDSASLQPDALSVQAALDAVAAGQGLLQAALGVHLDSTSAITGISLLYVPVVQPGNTSYAPSVVAGSMLYEPVYQLSGSAGGAPFVVYVHALAAVLPR